MHQARTTQGLTMIRITSILMLCFAVQIHGLADYKDRIPHGHSVPHPCFVNEVWNGVGHRNAGGGGFLNPFGTDFKNNGYQWDECLCRADSDGDGKTNGEELGDPDCIWTMGDEPEMTQGISHPGVCEPVNSDHCKQRIDENWQVCEEVGFTCEGIDDPNIFEVDKRFDEITIPAKETSYWCYVVEFDENVDAHGVAMIPILDNVDLVHHIDMYECKPGEETDDALADRGPNECGAMSGCGGVMLAAWQLGMNGICLNDNVGIRFGPQGAKVASLRIHYHNPLGKEGVKDASGFKFYMTSDLRDNDAGVLNIGNFYLEIPPQQADWEQTVQCSNLCTDSFKEPIYLSFGAMHMHYLGKGGYSELWRNGEKVQDIMIQNFYDYNSPHLENFMPEIEVLPGDTIKHSCRFQSMDRTDVTYRGQAATEEMCHIYFVHYPRQNLSECFSNGQYEPHINRVVKVESCNYGHYGYDGDVNLGDCDNADFDEAFDAYIKDAVYDACDGSAVNQQCLPGCADVVAWAEFNHTCLQGHTRDYEIKRKSKEFMRMMNSCKVYPTSAPYEVSTVEPWDCSALDAGGAQSMKAKMSLILVSGYLASLILL